MELTGPMLEACTARDVSAIFRLLVDGGMAQRQIAKLVGMSQSEVSEILNGRKVMGYTVLVRVAKGLGIPRGVMGLAYTEGEPSTVPEEVDEDVKRRALLAGAVVAPFGAPVKDVVPELPRLVQPTPLPSRLVASDVITMRKLRTSLQEVARQYGGCAGLVGGVANRSRALLTVPATDEIKAEMSAALAELHTMAGWCCVDGGFNDQARAYFATAMELGDSYQIAWALRHAGIQMVDAGAFNDALKAFQLASMGTNDPELTACLHIESAQPLAGMGLKAQALDALKKGDEYPQSNLFNAADMDNVVSDVYQRLGQLTNSEAFARASLNKWTSLGGVKRDSVEAEITLATVHLRSGEIGSGALLTRRAIADIAPLRSVRARARLTPLAVELEKRNDSTCQDLARAVRQFRVA